MSVLADFVDTYTLSAADVDACLAAGGLKGQQLFNAMAAFGQTTTATPLTMAQMAQVYILTDLDDVNVVINADALRSMPFMEAALAGAAA